MKNKLENLISFDDFKSNWKSEEAKTTKRTQTALDILKENLNDDIVDDNIVDDDIQDADVDRIEEIIPEGLPEDIDMSTEEKIDEINDFLDDDVDDDIIEVLVNNLRETLLEMEQQGFIDDDTTDNLDDKHDGDWISWIKDVIELPDFPEEGLNNVIEIIHNVESGEFVFDDEDFDDNDEDFDDNDEDFDEDELEE
jgi:hypothetical protein